MKKQIMLAGFAALMLAANFANAAGTLKYEGDGVELTPDGQELGAYHTVTTVTELAPGLTESVSVITKADGKQRVVTQKIQSNGTKFSIDSSLGKGGGACYGEGLCEAYIDAGAGKGYATFIVVDSTDTQRHLIVVLENGKAVKMLRDKVRLVK